MKRSFLALFIVLEFGLLAGVYLLWHNSSKEALNDRNRETQSAYAAITRAYGRVSQLMHDTLILRPGIRELFAQGLQAEGAEQARLRGRLLRALYADYRSMHDYNLVQLHFHGPDGRSFLRFHKPELSGDDLLASRPSIRQVLASGQPAQGFEIGKLFHGYRYVFPVHADDGRLIGSVETSIDFLGITRSLAEVTPDRQFSLWLRRDRTLERISDAGALLYPVALNPDYAIEDLQASLQHRTASSRPDYQLELEQHLQSRWLQRLIRTRMAAAESFAIPVHLGGLTCAAVGFLPIDDTQGRHSAYLVGYMPMPELHLLARNYLLLATLATLLLAALLLFVQRQHRDSQALERERQMLKGITDNMLEGLFVQDAAGRMQYWNPALQRLLGFTPEQLQGSLAHELIHAHDGHGNDLPLAQCPIRQTTLRGETYYSEQDGFLTASGCVLPVEVTCAPVQAKGRVVGSITVFRDATQRLQMQQAQEEARQAAERNARMKSSFLANMSHEIRTPINGLMGMLELAMSGPLTAEQHEYLEIARHSGEMLTALLNDILDISKVDAGHLQLEQVAFDLTQVVEHCARLMSVPAQKKQLELRLELAADTPRRVLGDPLRLRQVLLNLLSNAVKFTAEGQVTLSVTPSSERPGALCFAVRDTGIGIAAEAQAHIFEAFRQADDSTTRRYGGTGLGLSLSRRLVELMGGQISLQSSPGQGSCFSFELCLPVADGPAEATPPGMEDAAAQQPAAGLRLPDAPVSPSDLSPGLSTTQLRGRRVLLAEDHPVNRMLANRLLGRQGMRIREVEDGAQALACLESGEVFDIILMDCQMPVLDGPSATRAIRALEAQRAQPRTPILAITAHAGSEELAGFRAAGMDAVLHKPYSNRQLLAAIDALLDDRPTDAAPLPDEETCPMHDEVPLLDLPALATLEAALGDDLQQVIEVFCNSLPTQIGRLQAALEQAEPEPIHRCAHTLKGSAGNIGALALAQLAREIEQPARAGQPPAAELAARLAPLASATLQALHERYLLPA